MAACACCASAFSLSTMTVRGKSKAVTGGLWVPACRLHQPQTVQTRRSCTASVAMAANDEPTPAKRTVSSGRLLWAREGRDRTSHPRRASGEKGVSESDVEGEEGESDK